MHAWHNRSLFCAPVSVIRAWASFRVILKPLSSRFHAVHSRRHVVSILQNQITKLWQIAKGTSAACSHNAAPSLPRWTQRTEMRFLPARQFVSSVLPCAINLAEHDEQSIHPRTNPGGSLVQRPTPYMHKLCFVLVKVGRNTHLDHPSPFQKQTPHTGWMSWCIRKALFLIGIRTETAVRGHELMKGTGHIICPCVFCLIPAEKRDTLCSANELSAAITVYTAASKPYPCAFWHCAPPCLTRSMNVWPGRQGNTAIMQADQSMIVGGTRNVRTLEEDKINQMLRGAPVTLYAS